MLCVCVCKSFPLFPSSFPLKKENIFGRLRKRAKAPNFLSSVCRFEEENRKRRRIEEDSVEERKEGKKERKKERKKKRVNFHRTSSSARVFYSSVGSNETINIKVHNKPP
jgi:hypothetical protein